MISRNTHNFGAGPSQLPLSVLQRIKDDIPNFSGLGVSIMELGHRTKAFSDLLEKAIQDFRDLLGISQDYHILFLHGGCSIQYSMIPLNFMQGKKAAYVNTGIWSQKAFQEAQKYGFSEIVADGKNTGFKTIPDINEIKLHGHETAYLHITDNNTIYGTEFSEIPKTQIPLISDCTSSILSKKVNVLDYGMLYGGAQKFLGIAGLGFAIINQKLLGYAEKKTPTLLDYNTYATSNSSFNTCPVFPIYVASLMLEWYKEQGGVEIMEQKNAKKAACLYNVIDKSDFYLGYAETNSRSRLNINFNLFSTKQEPAFLQAAEAENLLFLRGHRLTGGVRASIYNSMDLQGVEALADFMKHFETHHA